MVAGLAKFIQLSALFRRQTMQRQKGNEEGTLIKALISFSLLISLRS
jgi:hypothetical protein